MHTHTNNLIHETSPYLLQHAHNPVDWNPWSEEILAKAKEENKPVLVSIGYAACHWCHVMEKESFEDEATAAIMNEYFINIKIDREERPDLDHIYMDAVQAMTGSGGWPLNVFLTPDGKPFYGGTYFPPRRAFNRASWTEVLQGVTQAFKERRHEIDAQAENLTGHLEQSNSFGIQEVNTEDVFIKEKLDEAFENIMKSADKEWGGFGNAPKFPQTFTIQFLLRYSYCKDSEPAGALKAETGLTQAVLSLDKMIEGGLYDQVGGGFARYSTDTEWLAPHFEKMLYDNALLLIVLCDAYQITRKERYREVMEETMQFIQRELLHPQKGFYTALDADSEGEEGKFYVWEKREVEELLGNDADLICRFYDVSNHGNWEGKNILHVRQSLADFAKANNISLDEMYAVLNKAKAALKKRRDHRPRPLLDDKILLGWNALMNTACSKVYEATGYEPYRQLAIDNMKFLLEKFSADRHEGLFHTWKNDKAKYPAFLDDYAFLVQALIQLSEVTADTGWLLKAKEVTEYVLNNFSEGETGFFYYTGQGQRDIIVRKKEVYDGAVPSGNSVMAYNLYRLSIYFDRSDWRERSYKIVASLGKVISRYPTSFGTWNCLLLEILAGTSEIAIVGKDAIAVHQNLLKEFIPHRALMASISSNKTFPLLSDKDAAGPASIFLCKNFACLQPVNTITALISLINKQRTYI